LCPQVSVLVRIERTRGQEHHFAVRRGCTQAAFAGYRKQAATCDSDIRGAASVDQRPGRGDILECVDPNTACGIRGRALLQDHAREFDLAALVAGG